MACRRAIEFRFLVRLLRSAGAQFYPGEIPDAAAFRAEASGQVAGGFALLDIETGLERPSAPAPMCRGTRLKQSISDGSADR